MYHKTRPTLYKKKDICESGCMHYYNNPIIFGFSALLKFDPWLICYSVLCNFLNTPWPELIMLEEQNWQLQLTKPQFLCVYTAWIKSEDVLVFIGKARMSFVNLSMRMRGESVQVVMWHVYAVRREIDSISHSVTAWVLSYLHISRLLSQTIISFIKTD